MTLKKQDADEILNFLEELQNRTWLKFDERDWWPKFLFHYTDLENAVRVLTDGYLFSRTHLETKGLQFVSSASSVVLNRTPAIIRDCVRMYFRPLTPTQYHSEGIRSPQSLRGAKYPEAHCPVPIFLLFDSGELLTRADCQFSEGGLGSMGQIYNSANELINLPWTRIYHTGWYDRRDPNQQSIPFHRNAEVIIPARLNLNALRSINCRSVAEKETLLYALPSQVREKYRTLITASTRNVLFNRRHTFIEKVRLSPHQASFYFSPDTKSPGPFKVRVAILDTTDGRNHYWESIENASGVLNVQFENPIIRYEVRLYLDNILTYANIFEENVIPF